MYQFLRIRSPVFTAYLLVLAINANVASAQEGGILPGLSVLSESDAREYAVAFVNTTTSPGLEGAIITLDDNTRQSKQWRSSLGFNAEFTLKNYIFNGYWGLAVVGGSLNDKIELVGDNGQPVQLDLTRNVAALRGSLGLSFPINQHFKLRPFLSLVVAELRSDSIIHGLFVENNEITSVRLDSKTQMLSTVGSLDALYTRWYGNNKLELSAKYNLIYTDAFSEDRPILDTTSWNDTAQIKGKISGPTKLSSRGRPWRWHGYASFISFLSNDEAALGYNNLLEIGTGLNWHINIKPLDWFGWETLGIRVGYIASKNVEGYKLGLVAQ